MSIITKPDEALPNCSMTSVELEAYGYYDLACQKYCCKLCPITYGSKPNFLYHVRSAHTGKLKCDLKFCVVHSGSLTYENYVSANYENGFGQIPERMHAPQMHPPRMHAPQMHPPPIHAPIHVPIHAPHRYTQQLHAPQMLAPQMLAPQMLAPQMHAPQTRERGRTRGRTLTNRWNADAAQAETIEGDEIRKNNEKFTNSPRMHIRGQTIRCKATNDDDKTIPLPPTSVPSEKEAAALTNESTKRNASQTDAIAGEPAAAGHRCGRRRRHRCFRCEINLNFPTRNQCCCDGGGGGKHDLSDETRDGSHDLSSDEESVSKRYVYDGGMSPRRSHRQHHHPHLEVNFIYDDARNFEPSATSTSSSSTTTIPLRNDREDIISNERKGVESISFAVPPPMDQRTSDEPPAVDQRDSRLSHSRNVSNERGLNEPELNVHDPRKLTNSPPKRDRQESQQRQRQRGKKSSDGSSRVGIHLRSTRWEPIEKSRTPQLLAHQRRWQLQLRKHEPRGFEYPLGERSTKPSFSPATEYRNQQPPKPFPSGQARDQIRTNGYQNQKYVYRILEEHQLKIKGHSKKRASASLDEDKNMKQLLTQRKKPGRNLKKLAKSGQTKRAEQDNLRRVTQSESRKYSSRITNVERFSKVSRGSGDKLPPNDAEEFVNSTSSRTTETSEMVSKSFSSKAERSPEMIIDAFTKESSHALTKTVQPPPPPSSTISSIAPSNSLIASPIPEMIAKSSSTTAATPAETSIDTLSERLSRPPSSTISVALVTSSKAVTQAETMINMLAEGSSLIVTKMAWPPPSSSTVSVIAPSTPLLMRRTPEMIAKSLYSKAPAPAETIINMLADESSPLISKIAQPSPSLSTISVQTLSTSPIMSVMSAKSLSFSAVMPAETMMNIFTEGSSLEITKTGWPLPPLFTMPVATPSTSLITKGSPNMKAKLLSSTTLAPAEKMINMLTEGSLLAYTKNVRPPLPLSTKSVITPSTSTATKTTLEKTEQLSSSTVAMPAETAINTLAEGSSLAVTNMVRPLPPSSTISVEAPPTSIIMRGIPNTMPKLSSYKAVAETMIDMLAEESSHTVTKMAWPPPSSSTVSVIAPSTPLLMRRTPEMIAKSLYLKAPAPAETLINIIIDKILTDESSPANSKIAQPSQSLSTISVQTPFTSPIMSVMPAKSSSFSAVMPAETMMNIFTEGSSLEITKTGWPLPPLFTNSGVTPSASLITKGSPYMKAKLPPSTALAPAERMINMFAEGSLRMYTKNARPPPPPLSTMSVITPSSSTEIRSALEKTEQSSSFSAAKPMETMIDKLTEDSSLEVTGLRPPSSTIAPSTSSFTTEMSQIRAESSSIAVALPSVAIIDTFDNESSRIFTESVTNQPRLTTTFSSLTTILQKIEKSSSLSPMNQLPPSMESVTATSSTNRVPIVPTTYTTTSATTRIPIPETTSTTTTTMTSTTPSTSPANPSLFQQCCFCFISLADDETDELRLHLLQHLDDDIIDISENSVTCPRCGVDCEEDNRLLVDHFLSTHAGLDKFGCRVDNCLRGFWTRNECLRHEKNHRAALALV